mmetsp:Transcript_5817/g.11973  ORF Transcript_5817/g.11973 Transcript_5817/m.11973 type:complete len:308 (-) Transcript_5817:1168-2091(-)
MPFDGEWLAFCNRLCSCEERCEFGSCAPGRGAALASWPRSDTSVPAQPGVRQLPLSAAEPRGGEKLPSCSVPRNEPNALPPRLPEPGAALSAKGCRPLAGNFVCCELNAPNPAKLPMPTPSSPRDEGAGAGVSSEPGGTFAPSPNVENLMFTFGSSARRPCCQSSSGSSSLTPPREDRGETSCLGSLFVKKRANRELHGNSSSSCSSATIPLKRSSMLPSMVHGSISLPVGQLPFAASIARAVAPNIEGPMKDEPRESTRASRLETSASRSEVTEAGGATAGGAMAGGATGGGGSEWREMGSGTDAV